MIGGQRNWGCRLAGGSLGRVGSTWAIVESRASPMGRERAQWIEMARYETCAALGTVDLSLF